MEWKYAVVSCASAATITVNDQPTLFKGLYVNTALSAHQADFKDGSGTVFKTAPSLSEGDTTDLEALRFESNCVVVCAASMTGNFTVLYKDLRRQ